MKRAKPQVISAVRVGFKSLWMTFSFWSSDYCKEPWTKQKYTVGLYWEVYFRKTKGIIKLLVKKKKEKYWTQKYWERIESNHVNVVTQEFLLAIFSKQRTKH